MANSAVVRLCCSEGKFAVRLGSRWLRGGGEAGKNQRGERLTVDGNSHGLGQDVAISADEDGDLGQRVDLEELGGRLDGVDELCLNVETVGLRDSKDGRGAGVAL
jgi:hypothetical protein